MPGIVIPFVRVNGQPYSWNSTLSRFEGVPWPGVVEWNWGEKLDVEHVRSQTQDGKEIGATGGEYEVEAFSCKMLEEDAQALITSISAMPPYVGSYGRTEFSVELQATEALQPGAQPIMLISERTRIIKNAASFSKGINALVRELGFWSGGLRINGTTMWTPSIPGVGAI